MDDTQIQEILGNVLHWLDQDYQDTSGVIEVMKMFERVTSDYQAKSAFRVIRQACELNLKKIEERIVAIKKEMEPGA